MKKTALLMTLIIIPAFLIACKTTPPGPERTKSRVNIPELTGENYRKLDTSKKIAGLYLYNSKLGPVHVEEGDMTLLAMKDVMEERVNFYKVDLSEFSNEEQHRVAKEVIGEPSLPSYIFIYRNTILAKKIGSYTTRESATDAAKILYNGFRDKAWRK